MKINASPLSNYFLYLEERCVIKLLVCASQCPSHCNLAAIKHNYRPLFVSLNLQERFQVKNPPSTYLEQLKSCLDHGGVGRKVQFTFIIPVLAVVPADAHKT